MRGLKDRARLVGVRASRGHAPLGQAQEGSSRSSLRAPGLSESGGGLLRGRLIDTDSPYPAPQVRLRRELDMPVVVLRDGRPLAWHNLGRPVRPRVEGHLEGRIPKRAGQGPEVAGEQTAKSTTTSPVKTSS